MTTPKTSPRLLRGAAVAALALSLGIGGISPLHAHASSLHPLVNNQGGNNQGSNNQGSNNQGGNNQGGNNQGSNNQGQNYATPELGSGELVATSLLVGGGLLLYRRRRNPSHVSR